MRRLNDWFTEFYQNLPSNRSSNRGNESVAQTSSGQQQQQQENTDAGSSTLADIEENSDENEEGVEMSEDELRRKETSERPFNLSPVTKCLINSRLKFKQAARTETNLIKKQPSPKVLMTYTGHRNSRTMVNFFQKDKIISKRS